MRRGYVRRAAGGEVRRDARSVAELDSALLRVVDDGFRDVAARAGGALACAAGCSDCCHGPFPITRLDAMRLRQGLTVLEASDPERARAIRERAREAIARLEPGYPGSTTTGALDGDSRRLDRYFERHGSLACPVLDPRTGNCELYDVRPIACRTYGPPLRFGERDAPHCALCFRDAEPETVESCRFTPDAGGLEATALRRLGVEPGGEWETLIAFALRPRARRERDEGPRPGPGDYL